MIESSCVYLFHDNQVLMLLRNKKENDLNHGKWIGIGGKKEIGESIVDCAIREVYEETGFSMIDPCYQGTVLFQYQDAEEEKITLYTCQNYTGEMQECNEGTLEWIQKDKVMQLNLWEGDKIFLKHLLEEDEKIYSYILQYDFHSNLIHAEEYQEKNND